MRPKGIVLLLTLIILFIVLPFFFLDGLIERGIETYASRQAGAKVELDNLTFSLLNSSMRWEHLQIADAEDPWKNIVETESCSVDLEILPLLDRKIIIDEVQVLNLQLNTDRTTDGSLVENMDEVEEIPEPADGEAGEFSFEKIKGRLASDSLLTADHIRTDQKVDSLLQLYSEAGKNLRKDIDHLPDQDELKQMEADIKSLSTEKVESVEQFQALLLQAVTIFNKADSIRKDLKEIKKKADGYYKDFENHPQQVKEWVRADYQHIRQEVRDLDGASGTIAQILFGKELANRLDKVIRYAKTGRKMYHKYYQKKPAKESPPRGQGQYIPFGGDHELPAFWVKEVTVSSDSPELSQLSGSMLHLSTNQEYTGEPFQLSLSGMDSDLRQIQLDALADYRSDADRETIEFSVEDIDMSGYRFSNTDILPYSLVSGNGGLQSTIDILDSDYTAVVDFTSHNVKLTALNPDEDSAENSFSAKLADSISEILVSAEFNQQGGNMESKISSNLDNLVKQVVTSSVDEKRTEIEQQITANIDSRTSGYLKRLTGSKDALNEGPMSNLRSWETALSRNQNLIKDKKKEIEEALARKQGDLLKDLFK